jgi:3-deoxy-D-manno-octulosonate 8-phosphate phosphatase (KDO 8-P phosphatase)
MQSILSHYSPLQIEKAKKIRAIFFDVDGVLTDGGIIYDNDGTEYKKFNVKDGQIVKPLRGKGFIVGAITGRASEVVKFRCNELCLDFHYHGVKDKLTQYQQVKEAYQLGDDEIAYIGDDLIDLPVLLKCGLGVAPADALSYVKEQASLVTQAVGGRGVLRETADFILAAQGVLEEIISSYCDRSL